MNLFQSIFYRLWIIMWPTVRSGIKILSSKYPQVVFSFPTMEKRVALTIDDSPNGDNTLQILSILRDFDVKATFFVIGSQMSTEEGMLIAQRIVEEGHELGNHSYYKDKIIGENASFTGNVLITDSLINEAYRRAGVKRPLYRWYRPPEGRFTTESIHDLSSICYTLVLTSLYAKDWKIQSPPLVEKFIIENAKPGDIIVLHDLPTTLDTLPIVLPIMMEYGYRFEPLQSMAK